MKRLGSWEEVQEALKARRDALNEEISSYPAPVPGCDAQFNHLLDERTRLVRELGRLESEKAKTTGPTAIADFIESCPFLMGVGGEKLT